VIEGGAGAIQLRDKMRSKSELLPLACELKNICARADVLFIINDYLDIAPLELCSPLIK
jgi:thiamine-phosphate pyrophosphorylase